MKTRATLLAMGLASLGILGIGCGDSVPVNPKPTEGGNPHVSGSPQERIARIQDDPTLSPEEKAHRVQVIKERNHLP